MMNAQKKPEDSGSQIHRARNRAGTVNGIIGSSSHRCFSAKDSRNMLTVSEEEHHTRLGEHAAKLWKYNKITDVTVKLRGVSYPAHKTVLSCYSRYFKEVLLESKSHMSVINLEKRSVSNEAFSVLLQFMYTASLAITCQNIGEVYTAARNLGMDEALNMCVKILSGSSKHDVHSVYTFVTAKKLGLTDASTRAQRNMCKRFEQIVGTPEYLDLSYDQVIDYLKADSLATRSEVIVFLAALKWISVRYLDREQFAVDVIGCVRFPMMTLNEILACHSPPLLPGLMEIPEIKEMLLKATCFIAAKTINEEKRFQKYSCTPRNYLLEREPIILWDPNIFDPERHALYAEEQAATTIQAAYRGYNTRRSISKEHEAAERIQAVYRGYHTRRCVSKEHQAAGTIQKAYRKYSQRTDRCDPPFTGYESASHNETDFDEKTQEGEEEKKGRFPLAEILRKSVTSIFRRASSQVQDAERDSQARGPGKDESKDKESGGIHKAPFREQTMEMQPPPPWIPEVSSSIDALAGTVTNVPKGGYKLIEEDAYTPDRKKYHHEDRRTHPPYKTEQMPQQQPPPPPWLPEVSSSLDALAGTVMNMTKNLEIPNDSKKSKGKLILQRDYHFENHDRGESLDSILANEKEYKSDFKTEHKNNLKTKYKSDLKTENTSDLKIDNANDLKAQYKNDLKTECGCEEEMFRAIIVAGGFNAKDGEETDSDYRTPTSRSSPSCCRGDDNGKLMFLYDPAANQWSGIGQMPKPRHHHRLVYLNDVLYSIGGCDPNITKQGKMVPLKTSYSFDLSSKKWRKLPRMHHCRMYHGAAALDGKVYVVGGKDDNDSMLDSIEVYDPESNKWQELPYALDAPTMGLGVCAHKGQLWVIGGMVQNAGKTDLVKDVRCYDPVEKKWNEDVPSLPFPRAFIAAIQCANRVYVLGGTSYADTDIYSDELNSLSEMLCYDETRKIWRKTIPMPEPCHFVGAATCGKSMFVLGGLTSFKREALDQVVVFTESCERWHRCSSLPVPLCGFAAVAVPKIIDGK